MTIKRYVQSQLASSRVHVPQVDRSGQIIARSVLQGVGQITNTIIQQEFQKKDINNKLDVLNAQADYNIALNELATSVKADNLDKPEEAAQKFSDGLKSIRGVFEAEFPTGDRNLLFKQAAISVEIKTASDMVVWVKNRNEQLIDEKTDSAFKKEESILLDDIKFGGNIGDLYSSFVDVDSILGGLNRGATNPNYDINKDSEIRRRGLVQAYTDQQIQTNPKLLIEEIRAGKFTWKDNEGISHNLLNASQLASLENLAQRKISQNEDEAEEAVYKEMLDDTLNQDRLDTLLEKDEISIDIHRVYTAAVKNKDFLNTDSILAEKWLNNTLTKDDIKLAQKEGRLNNSNIVASWINRISDNKFDVGIYDNALAKIRGVRLDKGKYSETRLWLLQNAEALGPKFSDVRNKLETNMNIESKSTNPHIKRAHSLIDSFAKDNIIMNDGTLASIERIQEIHDAVDARANQTPEQIRDLTKGLLLPFEEEEARGWFKTILTAPFGLGPVGLAIGIMKGRSTARSKEFQSMMLIQPISKIEFKNKIIELKDIFGENSKEANLFYEKHINSFDWENE